MKKDGLEKYCKFCEKATTLSKEGVVLCEKFGIVDASHKCRRFRYDPLKRMPKLLAKEPELEFVDVDETAEEETIESETVEEVSAADENAEETTEVTEAAEEAEKTEETEI